MEFYDEKDMKYWQKQSELGRAVIIKIPVSMLLDLDISSLSRTKSQAVTSDDLDAWMDKNREEILRELAKEAAEKEEVEKLGQKLYHKEGAVPEKKPDIMAETKPAATASAAERRWTQADLKDLKNTKNFTRSAIPHIFLGEINSRGAGAGYHYEGIEDSPGTVIEGTRSKPDSHGVYSGKVMVDGVKKTGNKGYSTFFPTYMTPQDVVDAINQAYENAERIGNDLYAGITDDGIEIDMYLTSKGKITTAYPVRED